jgi:hypothetical protein
MVTVTICSGSKKIPVIFIRYSGTDLLESDANNPDDTKRKRFFFNIDLLHKTSTTGVFEFSSHAHFSQRDQ